MRRKKQARGDDIGPQVQPESLTAISQFHGSRLASALMPSPFQQSEVQDNEVELKTKLKRILFDKSDVFNSKGVHEDKVKHNALMVEFCYLY
jgi:5'-3' exoribonuclease 2